MARLDRPPDRAEPWPTVHPGSPVTTSFLNRIQSGEKSPGNNIEFCIWKIFERQWIFSINMVGFT